MDKKRIIIIVIVILILVGLYYYNNGNIPLEEKESRICSNQCSEIFLSVTMNVLGLPNFSDIKAPKCSSKPCSIKIS